MAHDMEAEFETVHQKVLELAATHALSKGLYGDKSNVENMNRVSGLGFSLLQRSLHTSMLVLICALTDPPGSGQRENPTVIPLLEYAECKYGLDIGNDRSKLDDAIQKLRTYRDKTIAHLDKMVVLGKMKVDPLKVDDLERALSAVYETMNRIKLCWSETTTVYEFTSIGCAASAITWAIADSLRMSELRDKANRGKISPDAALGLLKERSNRNDNAIITQH